MHGKDSSILWEEVLQPGATWSHVVKRGTALRITDLEGGANVSALFLNFECPAERYNMPDTLKAQHIARLTKNCALYSDMGRVLFSVTEDSVGWHDTISGHSNAAMVAAKYGPGNYQDLRNSYHRNTHDSFLIELEKWGLSGRDLGANASFFSKVVVGDDGGMKFVSGNSKPEDFVELRAEMNVLTVLNTCQHPLDPNPRYQPRPVRLSIRKAVAPGMDDACRNWRLENQRGFTLTERYFV
jgi:urea carboxylase-associated protein 2